jgi:hypothetical protein
MSIHSQARRDAVRGRADDARAVARDLTICSTCDGHFVYPLRWRAVGPQHWRIELRCPDCEGRGTVVEHQSVVDHFDELLEQGAADLARDLHTLVQLAIDAAVEELHVSLASGLLLPEDF